MKLSAYVYDLGRIGQDSLYRGEAVIGNTGGSDLIVDYVRTGCGCTKAAVAKKTISPGDTTLLSFMYNSHGKKGPQQEFVLITANTDSLVHALQINAVVR